MQAKRLYIFLLIIGFKFVAGQSIALDSLRTAVELMPQDSTKCETYLKIAYLIYAGDESELYAYKALKLSKRLNNARLIGKSYHRLAWCHGLDEMDKKTAYLDSAMVQFTALGDLHGLGSVYDTKGTILTTYGSIKEGLESYQQSYAYYSKIPDPERQAGVLNNWAIAEYTSGNTKGALQK